MKINFKIAGLVLIVILVGLWGWEKWSDSRGPLKYQDLTVKDPYEAIARGTGGQVLKFEKDKMDGVAGMILDSDSDKDMSVLWVAEGQPAHEASEFKFAVDASITELSILVSTVKELPVVTVLDPSGTEAKLSKTVSSENATKLNILAPASGTWRLQISAHSNLHIKVKARSVLQIVSTGFVRPGGRPGHEGYFAYKGPLEKGKKEMALLNLIGVSELKDVHVKAVSLSGRILREADIQSSQSDVYARLEIPNESFRILLEGKNKVSESFQRMDETIFNLNHKEMIEFKTAREETKDSKICKTLNESTHWSMLSGDKGPGSAVVMCVEHREANGSRWESGLSFHVPVNSDRSELKTQLFSADYKKLSKNDCENAQEILGRYPTELTGSSEHKLKWSFRCQGGPSEFRGIMDVRTQ